MKKLFTLFTLLWVTTTVSVAEVLVTEYLSVTKGNQVNSSVKADTYYIISGIDQSSREFFLHDNGRQVKGSASLPLSNESTGSHIWTLKASGNKWVIINVGTGNKMNLGGSNGSAVTTSGTEQENAIHFDSSGYLTILNSNGQAIDMTANGANPTTWTGTTTPTGSRRLKMYEVASISTLQKKSLSLVPAPKQVVLGEGEFVLNNGLTIAVTPFSDTEAQNSVLADVARFITTLNSATGLACKEAAGAADITISENSGVAPEGYILNIGTNGVKVEASTPDGVYYALQSIMRLLPANVILGLAGEEGCTYSLPVARIEDEPRFGYRGFMLDVSRHFFTIEQVKKMIDLMAIYKMNVFHWHLTDDQGWRAEIKQYPLLTTKGAERKSSYDTPITRVEENGQVYWTGEGAQTNRKYGPFYYTQEEMKDVVRYAAERHIDVLPEVDMPGHFVAALAAYPQFSCHPDRATEVWINGGISADVLNVANPAAVQFAKNIITELCAIFPYPYFHIGGDECPTSQWESNTLCQEKLKELGKTSYRALQTEFIREINEHLASLGKKMFCWNESITENGANLELMKQSGATIMCWNPCQSGASKAASLGLNAIITEWGSGCYYINRRQSSDYGEPTAAGSGNDNVAATYNYVPVPSNVSAQNAKYYIGVQATFWTEHVSSNEYLEYLALPRFMCIAEAGWTPQEQKNWASFVRRMTIDTKMLDLGGYIYARHWMDDYVPRKAQTSANIFADGSIVTFTNQSADRGRCLADANGTLNGQGSACTQWTLEAAPTAGNFYIRSNVSCKYLYAGNGNSGTMVELSSSKTEWAFDTTTFPGYVAMCYNSTSGYAVNNNTGNTTKTRLFAHGSSNGASFWAMEAVPDNKLKEGETGLLAYDFYYRGISVGCKEFKLQAGEAYPPFEEYMPAGYIAQGATQPTGTVHLKSETIEIPVAQVPTTGHFYRFYNPAADKYLSADESTNYTYGAKQPDRSTIFYYHTIAEPGSRIMAYDRGLYMDGASLAETDNKGATLSVLPSLSDVVDMYNIVGNGDIRMNQEGDTPNSLGNIETDSETSAYDFNYRKVLSLPVSIGESGWTTFAAPLPVTIPQGYTAYVTAGLDDTKTGILMDSITPGTTIAANTGILLCGAPSSVVELTISESGCQYNNNQLVPSIAAITLAAGTNAYTFECDGENLSFKKLGNTSPEIPAHSCYLLGKEATAAELSIIIPGKVTGIDSVAIDTPQTTTGIYNIHGQALRAPQRGINIINGKKVVVK